MNDLLKFAIDAHGGMSQWDKFKNLKAEVAISGAIWNYKQQPDLFTLQTFDISTHEERVSITPFTDPGRKTHFVPKRLDLETLNGEIIESRENPEAHFIGQTAESPWDFFHVAFFASEALWTYLTSPFLYRYPGFVTEEIEPWHENGEQWRRLKVTFPDYITSHTKYQTTHFGPDGLMRRHDYTVDILGGATGANYTLDYHEFQGIKMPTRRRIYAYDDNFQKVPEPLLVSLDFRKIELT